MIIITAYIKTDYPEAFAIARKDRYRVVWLEDDLVYVTRKGKGIHNRYLVRFFVERDGTVKVNCRTIDNTECKGCKFKKGMCSHIAAAILRWEAKRTVHKKAA